jgi:hypothetical protein
MQSIKLADMEKSKKEINILASINQLLPGVKISPLRLGNEKNVELIHYFISPNNSDLSQSEYFYKKRLSFVHFTNLYAIQSIISERNIRLYNLNNLNDPREYSFAGDLNFFNHKNKKTAKENMYLLSMCEQNILTKNSTEIEFNLWRLYGDNGFGAAIILSFEINQPINWKDYFLSVVHYGASSRAKLIELNDLLKELEKETPEISVDLGQIVSFHKSKLYSLEQEIRLLFDNRDKNIFSATQFRDSKNILTSPIIRTDIAKSTKMNKNIRYLELPIYYNSYEPISIYNKIPIPKIECIILGYQYSRPSNIIGKLQSLCFEKLDYLPRVEKSRLTRYYHDK